MRCTDGTNTEETREGKKAQGLEVLYTENEGDEMNLNITNIDPETRGLLYRYQGESGAKNLAETLKKLLKEKYDKDKGEFEEVI